MPAEKPLPARRPPARADDRTTISSDVLAAAATVRTVYMLDLPPSPSSFAAAASATATLSFGVGGAM